MCCDTDGSGMHRLLCEPEPCLVWRPHNTTPDTRAIGAADTHTDTAAEHGSCRLAYIRAVGTAHGSPEPAAFGGGGVAV
jgi:hypothetical protein